MGTWSKYIGTHITSKQVKHELELETNLKIHVFKFGCSFSIVESGKNKGYVTAIKWSYSKSTGNLSYKLLGECCAPYYYGLPKKWLLLKPENVTFGEYSENWRKLVLAQYGKTVYKLEWFKHVDGMTQKQIIDRTEIIRSKKELKTICAELVAYAIKKCMVVTTDQYIEQRFKGAHKEGRRESFVGEKEYLRVTMIKEGLNND